MSVSLTLRRRLFAALAAVLGAALLQVPGLAQAKTRVFKIATISAANSPWDKAMQKFAQEVKKRSDGEMTVRVYTDAQLGDISKMLSSMQLGTLEMGYFGLGSAIFLRGGEPLNILYSPYLFKSGEWAEKVINSDLFKPLFDEAAKKSGVRAFAAYGIRSPRSIETVDTPVRTPADVKGLKLRIPSIPILKDTFQTLGAQVVPLSMTEIYTALSRGMIDGQDNGFDLSIPLRFYEVAKYWSATDHAYELTGWFISERLWQSLSDKERQILIDSAKAGGLVATRLDEELDEKALQTLKDAGVTYIVPDRAAFKKALAGVNDKFDGKVWPEGLVKQIRAMQE